MSQNQNLPPGVDAATLARFFDAASKDLGPSNVSRDPSYGALEGVHGSRAYGDPFPISSQCSPSGAVRPGSVGEVQSVLKLANEFGVPLWTVSRGKNLGYGGSAPVVNGSVILDLQRMNQVIEVSEEFAYAIVEPGISFFDLYKYLQNRGLKLWPSVPALGWGSVLGNTLDRGFGYTPDGEHSQAQCGLEVVLPSGRVLRTGMGAMEGNNLFALHKGGFGPSVDGLFFQSNLGVVTKMGIHLTPAPEAYSRCTVTVPNEADVVALVDITTDLLRRRIIGNSPWVTHMIQNVYESTDQDVMNTVWPYLQKDQFISDQMFQELATKKGFPYWRALFSLYGTIETVPALIKAVERAFEKIPGCKVSCSYIAAERRLYLRPKDVGVGEVLPQSGVPSIEGLAVMDIREKGAGHASVSPVTRPSGQEIYQWFTVAKRLTNEARFNFATDFHLWGRHILAVGLIFYADSEQQRASSLFKNLVEEAKRMGLLEYRAHVNHMDSVSAQLDFNDGALRQFTATLKKVLDPNEILSPGKSGIWKSESLFKRASKF
ncbi:hypothetical protein SLS56_010453 [Neofusicoccum ribis]|uniref:FAD-binding PCMH-type domain-containing protein n=1 Tax=Neofusicoccum ribis TaxID=45134 RepID=A0ABR3SEC3_9PEZI